MKEKTMDNTPHMFWVLRRIYWVDQEATALGARTMGLPGDCYIPF